MNLSRTALRDLVVAVLSNANLVPAGQVYPSRELPVQANQVPALLVFTHREKAEGLSRGTTPQFRATLTVVVEAIAVSADAETLETALDALADGVLAALLNGPDLPSAVSWFPNFDVSFTVKADGKKFTGSALIALEMVYDYTFAPNLTQPLASVGLKVDALYPFDPSGAYPPPSNPAYPVPPAPRVSGPDGRDEIAADLPLPTT